MSREEYNKRYREENRDKIREAQRKWYAKNGKEYRERTRDKQREYRRRYYYRNKERLKKESVWYQRLKKYGITKDHYLELYEKQEGKCGICQVTGDYTMAVDHCHTTGSIRGLLCIKCNTSLGGFNDNVALLKAAIDYLQDTREDGV